MNPKSRLIALVTAFLIQLVLFGGDSHAKPEIVFSGKPLLKISEMGIERSASKLSPTEQIKYRVVITQEGNKYFWRSRVNKPLTRSVSGGYTTFHATDGSGYIRIQSRDATDFLKSKVPVYDYNYMEHLLLGLNTITYYGVSDE